jgi:hypothetical protein
MNPKPWYRNTTLLLRTVAICLLIAYFSLLMGARFA